VERQGLIPDFLQSVDEPAKAQLLLHNQESGTFGCRFSLLARMVPAFGDTREGWLTVDERFGAVVFWFF